MTTVNTIGLDIAKNVFQVHGVDEEGCVVIRRQLRRRQVLNYFSKLSPCLIGIEACGTAHYWGRELHKLGHDVRLMPARYVKPYVKRNKNDAADAEAICEAVTRPTMRFVPIKTIDQQSVLMLHRTRQLFVRQRTSLINGIRSHLAEFGIVAGVGRHGVEVLLDLIRKGEDDRVPPTARDCLMALAAQLELIKRQILEIDRRVLAWHRSNNMSKRLEAIPSFGPLVASAIVASVPDPHVFRSGRDMSAWIGIVPRENSTGGKQRLGSISKAGNRYLRKLLFIGALAVIKRVKKVGSSKHPWLASLLERRSVKVAAIALANKVVRIAWAMMTRSETYRASQPVAV
ncbi:MAG: IS110 family transposase [Alphaproteobacteria bacterium GM202ARS2]|nr:IS110 family transposase [Alphaproteobacteria bacterium GM202ARS2]